jgi:hypothetical protein
VERDSLQRPLFYGGVAGFTVFGIFGNLLRLLRIIESRLRWDFSESLTRWSDAASLHWLSPDSHSLIAVGRSLVAQPAPTMADTAITTKIFISDSFCCLLQRHLQVISGNSSPYQRNVRYGTESGRYRGPILELTKAMSAVPNSAR